jgi:hypothetical protein
MYDVCAVTVMCQPNQCYILCSFDNFDEAENSMIEFENELNNEV